MPLEKISTEKKLSERISLVMRLFWQDEVFKIGKELMLPYFNQFDNYWDMNNYQGALQIAKAIDDEKLEGLIKAYPRPYGITLGARARAPPGLWTSLIPWSP